MMQTLGMPVTAAEVAKLYSDFVGVFVLDEAGIANTHLP